VPWFVIITRSGEPLAGEAGSPILFPSQKEARRWLMSHDLRIEGWKGGVKPPPPLLDRD
jgi:hypothetical protein